MTIEQLVSVLNNVEVKGDVNKEIEFITHDSRRVRKNTLFVCICGTRVDGNKFIPQAIEAGACAIMTEKDVEVPADITVIKVPNMREAMELAVPYFYDYPGKKMRMIGVTGTNGKTSSTYMLRDILRKAGYKVGVIGTIKIMIEDEEMPIHNTTPDVIDLQEILDKMYKQNIDYVVMEVSSHALDMNRIAGCEYDTAMFTNLTQDHLDYHKTIEEYIRVKNSFFADETLKIINADEPRAYCNPSKLYTYGIESNANLKVNAYSLDHPMCAHIRYNPFYGKQAKNLAPQEQSEETLIEVPLYGKHNLYNVLGALLCVKRLCMEPALCSNLDLNSDISISIESIAKKLENFGGVEGRMEVVSQNPLVIVDFAHTHDGMRQIFESFKTKKIVVLFGAGGDRDRKEDMYRFGNSQPSSRTCQNSRQDEVPFFLRTESVAALARSRQSVCYNGKRAWFESQDSQTCRIVARYRQGAGQ